MNLRENISIAPFTTFKIGGRAKFFCTVKNVQELKDAVSFAKNKNIPFFILGGGSNILVNDNGYSGLVIKMDIKGIQYDGQNVTAMAGEGWDTFVGETIDAGLYGLENLSSIPGTVGASPVQNIGAYGIEVGNKIVSVDVLDTSDMQLKTLDQKECEFGYRDSIFKKNKNRYVIFGVRFALNKDPQINIEYKDLREYFAKNNFATENITTKDVRNAVIAVRANKLPDWKVWGTAGSFFKNPIISKDHFDTLKKQYSDLPGYPEVDGGVKVSLAWILDNLCNVKGLCEGNACVYEKHALVLVSKAGANSSDVVTLARKLMNLVKEKTNIDIEAEVEWVN